MAFLLFALGTLLALPSPALAQFGPGQGFWGTDPDHVPTQRRYEGTKYGYRGTCSVGDFDLTENDASVETILDFLSLSPSVAREVSRFRPLFEAGEVTVEELTEARRRASGGEGVTVTYLYDTDTGQRTIFVDFDVELGILAGFFAHEMTHALDPELHAYFEDVDLPDGRYATSDAATRAVWESVAAREGLTLETVTDDLFTEADSARLVEANAYINDSEYWMEYRAFETANLFVDELSSANPCYRDSYLPWHLRENRIALYADNVDFRVRSAYGLRTPAP